MAIQIHVYGLDGNDQSLVQMADNPDTCPLCHRALQPKFLSAQKLASGTLEILYRCTSRTCERSFIARTGAISKGGVFTIATLVPMTVMPASVPAEVAAVSPSFVEIYGQAAEAEAAGLTELVGIGLRKSIEFLIKDYLCQEHKDKEVEIKKTALGKCISVYIDDSNLKLCAQRATWLGNDETHYVRRWETKDITDLKRLVQLTINWIHNHLLTKQYEADMPE